MIKLVLLALTAVLAGLVPTLLFFQTAADRRVFAVGGVAVAASYGVVLLGLPGIVVMTINGLNIYPVWAMILGFVVAAVWKVAALMAPAPPSEADRLETIQRRAREKARAHARDEGRRG